MKNNFTIRLFIGSIALLVGNFLIYYFHLNPPVSKELLITVHVTQLAVVVGYIVGYIRIGSLLRGLLSTKRVVSVPGAHISRIVAFIYPKKIKERVFDSIIADMQEGYFEALDKGFVWKARWIHARGVISVLIAAVSQLSVSMVKIVIDIWKIS